MPANPKRQEALLEFVSWSADALPTLRHNVINLKAEAPPLVSNPVLRFAIPAAMVHSIEHSILRVYEAIKLLDAELQHLGLQKLDDKGPILAPVIRLRHKLVAHRVENAVGTGDEQAWYKATMGSYEAAFAVVGAAAQHIAGTIIQLHQQGQIGGAWRVSRTPPAVTAADVQALIAALGERGIL